MPIYIDRHYLEDATKQSLSDAHEKDIHIQDKYSCTFLTYWFDEDRSTAFCLVDAPSKDAICKAHDEAHGDVPHEILEVDPSIVESFLGRMSDPEPDETTGQVEHDSAFRAVMFTDLKDSTLMTSMYGDEKALHLVHVHNAIVRNALREFGGSEIKHTGDGIMASFANILNSVNCGKEIQKGFAKHNANNPDESLFVKIGISAGEPIEEHGDLFGIAVQLSARLCSFAQAGDILVSDLVYQSCANPDLFLQDSEYAEMKGFLQKKEVYRVR